MKKQQQQKKPPPPTSHQHHPTVAVKATKEFAKIFSTTVVNVELKMNVV